MSEPTLPEAIPAPCPHEWECIGDEGDFSTGTEYDIYKCKLCGKREYEEVAQ